MVDLNALKARLESRAMDLLPQWLPGGKLRGKYFEASDVRGGDGDSLKYDMNKHKWMDYANRESMGDIIDLYAQSQGVSVAAAIKTLSADENMTEANAVLPAVKSLPPEPTYKIIKPPAGNAGPNVTADHIYEYRDTDGSLNFVIARIDATETSGKRILQFGYDFVTGGWVGKSFPKPRPLFGLELINADKPIVIVEGEKSCLAARSILGDTYTVMTWAGGSAAAGHADWSTITGRRILIWPDADEPGFKAAELIASTLVGNNLEVKIINVTDMPKGWDAADAVRAGMTWAAWREWAKPRVFVYSAPEPEIAVQQKQELQVPIQVPILPTAECVLPINSLVNPGDVTIFNRASAFGLCTNAKGSAFINIYNAERALSVFSLTHDLCWYDEFHQRILRKPKQPGLRPTSWTDGDTLEITTLMQREAQMGDFSDDMWFKAITAFAMNHRRNELMDWVNTLQWDGVKRLDTFMEDCLGVESSLYARHVSRNFWRSMLARAANPGCKVDTMVILEGNQGTRKSSALAAIAGPHWHTEATESITTKDFYLCLQGKLLVEIAELDSFGKSESTKIKQVITNQKDTYRSPYGRCAADHPRMCIFAGTTNEKHYLKDSTGGRRFWPIQVGEVDLGAIRDMREQCFAEAYHDYKQGATWWDMPEADTAKAQSDRKQIDIWEDIIAGWIGDRAIIAPQDIYLDVLGLDIAKQDQQTQRRVAAILGGLGYISEVRWYEGRTRRLWVKSA